MELKEVFDKVAAAPAPPSRLTADGAYRAGQRRHRTLITGRMLGLVLIATVLLVGATTLPRVDRDRHAGTGIPAGGGWLGPVLWAGGLSRTHLFALLADCATCPPRMVGTDDGGTHWTDRSLPPEASRWQGLQAFVALAEAPPVLTTDGTLGLVFTRTAEHRPLASATPASSALAATRWSISSDGARTWRPVTTRSTPVPAMPPGGTVDCVADTGPDDCTGYAVDPVTATESPLEQQPTRASRAMSRLAGPTVWATSDDDLTSRPAVSVSHDGGQTWTTHEFTDLAAYTGQIRPSRLPVPATRDGHTAYVVISDDAARATQVYRSDDGGTTWQHIDTGHSLPYADVLPSVVLPDGTLLVQAQADGRVERWVGPDRSGRFVPVTLAGLPQNASAAVSLAEGSYLAYSRNEIYTSADGLSWTAQTMR